MFLCSFMQSFNVPTRMIWGFPTPSRLYTKLWKFLPFKNYSFTGKFGHRHVCASQSPFQVPLGTQKAPFFFVSPKYIVYPSAHRTGVRHRGKLAAVLCILAVANFSESELQKGKGSLTSGVFSQLPASWGWWESVHPACLGGSPSFSPLLQCIFNTWEFCSSGLAWRSFRTWSTGRERLFGNDATWEGDECPDEGSERLEKFRAVPMEQFGTNVRRTNTGITWVRKTYLHPVLEKAFPSNCISKYVVIWDRKSVFHGLHLLFLLVKSVCRKKYIG